MKEATYTFGLDQNVRKIVESYCEEAGYFVSKFIENSIKEELSYGLIKYWNPDSKRKTYVIKIDSEIRDKLQEHCKKNKIAKEGFIETAILKMIKTDIEKEELYREKTKIKLNIGKLVIYCDGTVLKK